MVEPSSPELVVDIANSAGMSPTFEIAGAWIIELLEEIQCV